MHLDGWDRSLSPSAQLLASAALLLRQGHTHEGYEGSWDKGDQLNSQGPKHASSPAVWLLLLLAFAVQCADKGGMQELKA